MEYIVKKTIQIKANPEKVWEALTNPEKTKKYFLVAEYILIGKKKVLSHLR